MKLIVTCTHLTRHLDGFSAALKEAGIQTKGYQPINQQFNHLEMLNLLPGNDFIIAGDDDINEEVINKSVGSGLKAIIKWGIGVDNIDKEAARRNNIPIFNTPNVFGSEVAEQALSMILNLSRGTHIIDKEVRQGNWLKIEGNSLTEKDLGIIGFGSIGKSIAERAIAFGMKISFYDPFLKKDSYLANNYLNLEFEDLCKNSDFVVIACSLTKNSFHLINKNSIELMRKNPYIINVSRGSIINEKDLIEAIKERKIKGAGLDVFEDEPLSLDSELLKINNCILGSHNSSNTYEAVKRVNKLTIEMVIKLATKENKLELFKDRRVL
tara:strand:- start:2446 stop:3420 length:975 start_codon:yes stop_codon:yes gene_type:complete